VREGEREREEEGEEEGEREGGWMRLERRGEEQASGARASRTSSTIFE
jgi:hypothetical protein